MMLVTKFDQASHGGCLSFESFSRSTILLHYVHKQTPGVNGPAHLLTVSLLAGGCSVSLGLKTAKERASRSGARGIHWTSVKKTQCPLSGGLIICHVFLVQGPDLRQKAGDHEKVLFIKP